MKIDKQKMSGIIFEPWDGFTFAKVSSFGTNKGPPARWSDDLEQGNRCRSGEGLNWECQ